MLNLLQKIFTALFVPGTIETHREHFVPGHLMLMKFTLFSNGLIFLAYLLIPLATIYLIRKRRDLVYAPVFLLIGTFVSLCGLTHLMHMVVFFYSLYWLQGTIEMATAIASGITFIVLLFEIPKISALTSPSQLDKVRMKLEEEVEQHRKVEQELALSNKKIETSNEMMQEKIDELTRLNNLMEGRERRILELESELREFKKTSQI